MEEIQRLCKKVQDDEQAFIETLRKKIHTQDETERRRDERELNDIHNRLANIDRIIEKLYEDRVEGTLSTERFTQMLGRYEEEVDGPVLFIAIFVREVVALEVPNLLFVRFPLGLGRILVGLRELLEPAHAFCHGE